MLIEIDDAVRPVQRLPGAGQQVCAFGGLGLRELAGIQRGVQFPGIRANRFAERP
ncbi:hypothetical protein [Spirillospora sp. NPDC048824]|uniref:hypothetical protein n=1 Tax=unclassified Spirillospora TaxID=2642701 RepID=UPI003722AC2E